MTWTLLFKKSTTASRIPGSRLTASSIDPVEGEHVILSMEKRAFASDLPTLFSLVDMSLGRRLAIELAGIL